MNRYGNVTIVGVGLIGGSIGLTLRHRQLAKKVMGVGRRQVSLRTARRVGAIDNTTTDLPKGVADADLIVVCSPVGMIVEHVRLAAEHCPPDTLITDAGSTKQSIVEALDTDLARGCRFLGSHPLAGSEKTGSAAARDDLFEGRVAVMTPTKRTRAEDFDRLEQFWSDLGAVVFQMSAEEHDRALALSSHLPHAVAVALAASLPEPFFRLSGTGFADTTRLASGSPELWKQIFSLNRANLLVALDLFDKNLGTLRSAIEQDDNEAMESLLSNAKKVRDALGS